MLLSLIKRSRIGPRSSWPVALLLVSNPVFTWAKTFTGVDLAGPAFILHGWPKIQNAFAWMGPETPAWLQALAAFAEFGGGFRGGGVIGPWVLPGTYTVRLRVGGETFEQPVVVSDDPRIDITDAERRHWHETLVALAADIRSFNEAVTRVNELQQQIDSLSTDEQGRRNDVVTELEEIVPLMQELRRRMIGVYTQIERWPGDPTADQQSQIQYYREWMNRLTPRARRMIETDVDADRNGSNR